METLKAAPSFEGAVIDSAARAEGATTPRFLGGRKRDRIKSKDQAVKFVPSEGDTAEAEAVRNLSFRAQMPRPAAGAEGDPRIAWVVA